MVNGQPAVPGFDGRRVDAQFARLPIVLLLDEQLRFSESEQVFRGRYPGGGLFGPVIGARLGGPVQKQDLLCVFVVPGRRIKYG